MNSRIECRIDIQEFGEGVRFVVLLDGTIMNYVTLMVEGDVFTLYRSQNGETAFHSDGQVAAQEWLHFSRLALERAEEMLASGWPGWSAGASPFVNASPTVKQQPYSFKVTSGTTTTPLDQLAQQVQIGVYDRAKARKNIFGF